MSASPSTVSPGMAAVRRQLVAAVCLVLGVLMPVLALVLLVRRLSGAFDRPLGGLAIVAAAVVLVGATWMLRRVACHAWFPNPSTQYPVLSTKSPYGFGIYTVVAIAILASLTLPGTPVAGIILAWLVLIAGEVTQGLFDLRPELRRLVNTRPASAFVSPADPEVAEAEIPAGLVQRLTLVREAERESLHALVRAEIPSGDRLAVVHLSFCPPLAGAPELTAHAVDADTAEVRVTQAETFGARIEVRLPREDETPRSVMVEVLGTVTAPRVA